MNNPGIDLEIWKKLRKKWLDLHSSGHKVSVEFKLVSHPADSKNILAIDVVQRVDDEVIVETVEKKAREAYAAMGIHGLSVEQLKHAYTTVANDLYKQSGQRDAALTVTMTPTSPASGELRGVMEERNPDVQNSVAVNYRHYYVLNALREKMIEELGENWSRVKAVYHKETLEFYFDYQV